MASVVQIYDPESVAQRRQMRIDEQINQIKRMKDETRALEMIVSDRMRQQNVTPEHERQMIELQVRADSICKDLGRVGAPPPRPGETLFEFRRRVAAEFLPYSKGFSKTNLDRIPDAALDEIEPMIYADATAYAANPIVAPGEMIAITKEGANPTVQVTKYMGSPSAWMNEIAGPVRQFVKAWNSEGNPFGVDIFSH